MFDLAKCQTALEEYFALQPGVELAYLFGSQARGKASALSDVDVAVLLDDQLSSQHFFEIRLRIMGDLMDILGINEVDVAILNQATVALRYRVLRDGLLLYCHNRDRLIAFRLQTVNEYLDFKPILERHEQAVLAKARKGELLSGYDPHRGTLERYRQLRERLEETATPNV